MDGKVVIGTELDTKGFDAQIKALENKLEMLEKSADESNIPEQFRRSADETRELNVEIEKTRNQLIDLYKKQEQGTAKMGSSLGKITKKVGKWGLALFGIRSAYMFIRQSMSTLAEHNQDLANKINVIKTALATSLEPIITWIVDKVYQLVGLLGTIIKKWTGFDIFKNSSKSLKSGSKAAKDLKKQLAGFDEMTVLQDNKTAGGGAGGTSGKIPDFDKDFKVSSITDKIKEIENAIYDKIIANIEKVLKYFGEDGEIVKAVKGLLSGLKIFVNGFLDLIGGIGDLLVGIFTGDTDKIKEAFSKMWVGIKELFVGQFAILLNSAGIFVQSILNIIKGMFEPIKEGWTKLLNWLNDKIIKPIKDKINGIKTQIKDNFKDGFWKGILNTFVDMFNKIIEKINSKLSISISSTLSKVLGAIGVKVNAGKYQLFTIPKIPKLAKGGIINMPSRGVPVGGAVGGERGAEGIIPLTDSQQMALLGEAIGKYITINASITNTMNGRVISKELQKINAENDFAYNR